MVADWVSQEFHQRVAEGKCDVSTTFTTLCERVGSDLDRANELVERPGHFHVFYDTEMSFQVREGPADRYVIRAVFAKHPQDDAPCIVGQKLVSKPMGGYEEGEGYKGTPTVNDALECVLSVNGRLLTPAEFSQLVLSPLFRR